MSRKQRTYARFTEFTDDDGEKVRYTSLIPTLGNLRELRHLKADIKNLKRYSLDLENLVKEGDLTPEDTVLEGHLIWKDRFAKMLHKWATAEVLDFFMHGHLPQDLLVGGKRTKIYYNDAVPGLEPEEPAPAPEPDAQPKRYACVVNSYKDNSYTDRPDDRSLVFILWNRNDREINRLRHAIADSSYHRLYLQLDPAVSISERDIEQ